MPTKSAKFVQSSVDISKCPPADLPEYAFIGRSNVGKSSLINMLCSKKELAHTSSKPGKTQLINHFIIDDNWYLVDLPGYGYSSVSKTKQEEFEQFVREYLYRRTNLMAVMVLIDSRLPMQPIDKAFMEWLAKADVPFAMVFTKTDKLGKTQLETNLNNYKEAMLQDWEELPTHFITSAEKQVGREEILSFIRSSNSLFKKAI